MNFFNLIFELSQTLKLDLKVLDVFVVLVITNHALQIFDDSAILLHKCLSLLESLMCLVIQLIPQSNYLLALSLDSDLSMLMLALLLRAYHAIIGA